MMIVPRPYHDPSVVLAGDDTNTRWIAEDRSGASWTAADRDRLIAWIEHINPTVTPRDPANTVYPGGSKVVPADFRE